MTWRYFLLLSFLLLSLIQNAMSSSYYVPESISFQRKGININLISKNTLLFNNEKNPERYSIKNIVDDNISTAWVTKTVEFQEGYTEGTDGDLSIEFEKPIFIKTITIVNGYQKSSNAYKSNQRAKTLYISPEYIGGPSYPMGRSVELPDSTDSFKIDFADYLGPISQVLPITKLVIAIENIYESSKFKDLCISEIEFDFAFKPTYIPKISLKKLLKEISMSIEHPYKTKDKKEKWDSIVISRYDKNYFFDLVYYAMNRNKEAQKLFINYAPTGTSNLEEMSYIYIPAYEAYLKLNP